MRTSAVKPDSLEVHEFAGAGAWERWLAMHHDSVAGVWLRIAKKGSGVSSVSAAEAGDVALCYGWIDSHRKGLDATRFLQKYSPRRPKGTWSRVNVARVERLIAAGRMREPGFREIAVAKADGRWEAAYESQKTATVPPDLAGALDANDRARRVFESLGRTERYGLLLRLLKATSSGERARRVEELIGQLETRATAP